jgi:hypothetical protein
VFAEPLTLAPADGWVETLAEPAPEAEPEARRVAALAEPVPETFTLVVLTVFAAPRAV